MYNQHYIHPFATAGRDEHTHIQTYEQLEVSIKLVWMCLECGGEAAEQGQNPHRKRKNMQTPPSTAPGSGIKPSYCCVTQLSTAIPCRPQMITMAAE